MKALLESMLQQALQELNTRAKQTKTTVPEIQRMYGFCLGVRSSIMLLNRQANICEHDFIGNETMTRLMKHDFGSKNKAQTYDFPVFTLEITEFRRIK